jgi:RNA polymerase nonessential primary-like sigma factor
MKKFQKLKKFQRYLRLVELRSEAALSGDEVIQPYVHLIEAQERLASGLGHRPSLERWADTAGIPVSELKPMLARGKRRWAEIASLAVEEVERIQTEGDRAKEHMIKANLRLVVSVAKKYQNRGLNS